MSIATIKPRKQDADNKSVLVMTKTGNFSHGEMKSKMSNFFDYEAMDKLGIKVVGDIVSPLYEAID